MPRLELQLATRSRLAVRSMGFGLIVAGGGLTHAQCEVSWTRLEGTGPSPPEGHAMAYDAVRDRVVLFGGFTSAGENGETWEFDGNHWALIAPAGPSRRWLHTMVFEPERERVLMTGGRFGPMPVGGTLEWDGSAWSSLPAPGGIEPNAHSHSMAFDHVRQAVVVCLGQSGSFPSSEIWEYSKGIWAIRGGLGAGTGWLQSSAVFHPGFGGVVIVGGTRDFNSTPGGGWLWNGEVVLSPQGIGLGAFGIALAFDTARQRAIAFGGDRRRAGVEFEFLGTTQSLTANGQWTSLSLSTGPSPRARASMVYDSVRDRIILFGGRGYEGLSGETWVLSSPPVSQISQHPQGTTVNSGGLLTLSTEASSSVSLQYGWVKDGVPLLNGGRISGALSPTLSISPALLADAGQYSCTIFDGCSTLTTTPATVVVRCEGDASGDGSVGFLDLNIVLGNFGAVGAPGALLGDVNNDGVVSFADLNVVLSNFGRIC